jgi:hypothetical protein
VRERVVRDEAAADQEHQADRDVEGLARREVQHREEDPEEEQRGPEVLFEHHDEHGHEPHRDDRQQVRDRRHGDRAESPGRGGQHLAVLLEVRREEDHEGDLHELPGLELREARDADPDARTVDLAADEWQQGRDQEEHPDERPRVLEPGEHREVARDEDRDAEGARRDDQPRELLQQQRRREALDQHESDPGQPDRQRHEQLIAAESDRDEEDVEQAEDREDRDRDGDLVPREPAGGRGHHGDVADEAERRDPDEEPELRKPGDGADVDHWARSRRRAMRPTATSSP